MGELKALIVDDDWKMRNLLRIYLSKDDFDIAEAADGDDALKQVKDQAFDIILLDVMMPQVDGWQVCRSIREIRSTPILMLTALTETKDKVQGLELGADDYLTKPFEPEELIARIHSLLRRCRMTSGGGEQSDRLEFPGITIDIGGRQVFINNKVVELTQKEFDLLVMLARNSGLVLSREQMIERIWGYDFAGDSRVVDIHVKNIREKLNKSGLSYYPIQTAWGIGYKFESGGQRR